MKIAEANVEIEQSKNLQTGSFSIDFDAKMADMLSNKIYSDPIMAVVREYICNAVDAHKSRHISKAIDIQVPNALNPTWSVRDYGPGLSQEQIMGKAPDFRGLFNTYGRSDKSHANDAIGGFGLGSKAGFAYIKKEGAFTVTSYHGGFKTVYTCHRNQKGIPSVTRMAQLPSKEPTGLHIAVPVDSGDFFTFKIKTKHILQYMEAEFTTNDPDALPSKVEYAITGNGWGMRNDYDSKCNIIMGGVSYVVNKNLISSPVARHKFDVHVPIGSVELSVSREALSYEKDTIEYLEKRFREVVGEVASQFQKEINSKKDLREASLHYHAVYSSSIHDIVGRVVLPFTYKGKPLMYASQHGGSSTSIGFDIRKSFSDGSLSVKFGTYKLPASKYENCRFYNLSLSSWTKEESIRVSEKAWSTYISVNLNDIYTFVFDDGSDKLRARMIKLLRDKKKIGDANCSTYYFVRGISYRAFLNIVAKSGRHNKYMNLGDIAPAERTTISSTYKKPTDSVRNINYLGGSGDSNNRNTWFTSTTLDFSTKEKTFYIPTKSYCFYSDFDAGAESSMSAYTLNALLRLVSSYDPTLAGCKIYLVPFTYKNLTLANKNLVNFIEYVDNFYDACLNDQNFLDEYFTYSQFNGIKKDLNEYFKKLTVNYPAIKDTFIKGLLLKSDKCKAFYDKIDYNKFALFSKLIEVKGSSIYNLKNTKSLIKKDDPLTLSSLIPYISIARFLTTETIEGLIGREERELVALILNADNELKGKK